MVNPKNLCQTSELSSHETMEVGNFSDNFVPPLLFQHFHLVLRAGVERNWTPSACTMIPSVPVMSWAQIEFTVCAYFCVGGFLGNYLHILSRLS